MENKRFRLVVAAFLTLTILSILPIRPFLNENARLKAPLCTNGFIDLSKWDFNKNGNIKLNGHWVFYPNVLLTPEEIDRKPLRQKLHIKVPSRWMSKETDSIISDQGIGTYRLKVKTNNSIYMYGLKTTNIRSASKIFVNGKEVGKSGNPAGNIKDGYVGNVVPVTAFFPSDGDTLDIVIQVANLDYYNGGIIQSIYLGSKDTILNYYFQAHILAMLGISFLLLSGIYYLGIHFKRKQDKHFLYFGIACIAYSFIIATGDEKIFNRLFDFLPFMLILKARIAAICLSIIFVSLFIRELGKDFIPNRAMKAIVIILSSNIFLILGAPIKYMHLLEKVIGCLYLMVYILIAGLVFKAIMNKKYGSLNKSSALFVLVSIILIILSLISAFLYFYSAVNNNVLPILVLLIILVGTTALFMGQYSKAYTELENMSYRLIEADKAKDEFLVHTSHEFKTPLHGIINIAQAILHQNSGGDVNKQQEKLTYIISIATRLSSLVNDIIDFQSLQNNNLRLNQRTFDINGPVQAVVEVLKYMRKGEEIELLTSIPTGQFYAYTDENRFKQVIVNLLSNSLKYTEKGTVKLKAEAVDNYIYLSVEDTGIGIDKTVQNELFKGKIHSQEVNFSDYSSSGLGLSIAKMLADHMGGDLYLKWSEPKKGSIFVLKLPLAPEDRRKEENIQAAENGYICEQKMYAAETAATLDEYSEGQGIQKLKILIVDDEASNIRVLQEIFYEEHYETLVAYNGFKALELINSHNDITIVLLDVMMPGLSGYEVCKVIRQDYRLFELPILLLTVRNTPEDVALGLAAGANDFLVKPFDARELTARVGTLQKMKEAVENALKMETAFLQSQIKPHFLYNALSVIMSLCYSDGEKAGNLLSELSNYLRCSFDIDPHNSFVSLKKELSFVKSYVELEKARFGERLQIEFSIEERALGYRIPALIIQPIVENSIRHGLMKRISGGSVKIIAEIENNNLIITISDNGVGISSEKLESLLENRSSTGNVGLRNVHKRLLNEYGQGLLIDSIEGKGTQVIISIPIKVTTT